MNVQEAIILDSMSAKADKLSAAILDALKNGNKDTAYMEGRRDALRDMVRNGVDWALDAAREAGEEVAEDDYLREWLRGYSEEVSAVRNDSAEREQTSNAVTRETVGRAYELCRRAERLSDEGKLHPAFYWHIERVRSWVSGIYHHEYIIANKPRLAAALEKAKATQQARANCV